MINQVLMRALCFLSISAALLQAQTAQAQVKVVRQAAPDKALIFEIVIPAPPAAVWQAFSTSDGLSTWLTPGAVVDLRPGGEWTAHFPGGKTGGGAIVSFVPQKEMIMSALAPEQFPTVRRQRLTAKFEFVAEKDSTVVRLIQTGWQSGEEWDRAYEYLAKGNAQLLETLKRRFVEGPIDWAKEWGMK